MDAPTRNEGPAAIPKGGFAGFAGFVGQGPPKRENSDDQCGGVGITVFAVAPYSTPKLNT